MASFKVKEPTVPTRVPVARSIYENRIFEKIWFYTVNSKKKKTQC